MAGVSKQKQKLLVMEQLFRQRTDESHVLTGNDLIRLLGEMGIKAERKTIYDDIATLCDAGLNIRTTKSGHSNAYYMGERTFNDEELMTLSDCVCSSRYLTIKRSSELVKKLQTLTSEYKAPMLKRQIHIEGRTKSPNDGTYKIVDTVTEAISSDKQIEMTVAPSGMDRKKAGEKRLASPYQIVFESEHYYILCCDGNGVVERIRAERILDAEVTKEKRVSLSDSEEIRLRKMRNRLGAEGSTEQIRLRFDEAILDDIFDRFGDKTAVRQENSAYTADVTVQLTAEFWGWLFGFGEKARIVSPSYVKEIAGERLERMANLYK